MAQMTGKQGIKICQSIEQCAGKQAANDFAAALPLSKSADYIHKFKWAQNVCKYLESNFSSDDILKIRIGCSCSPSDKEMERARLLFIESENLDEFCEKYNSEHAGQHSVWHESRCLFFSYPTCYCSCVKRVNAPISKAWCLCTLGYTKKLFDHVIGGQTTVDLIESIKTSGNRCVIKITPCR